MNSETDFHPVHPDSYNDGPSPKQEKIICEFDDCSKIFKSKKTLKDHIKIHKGERPYSCQFTLCDKTFTQYSSYQKHQRTHSGEKPYVCNTCGQAFAQASNRKRHEKVHSGEKAHICEICSKEFITSSNLKQHTQTHLELMNRSKYKCDDCGKEYNYNSSLKKHAKVHKNEGSKDGNSPDLKYDFPEQIFNPIEFPQAQPPNLQVQPLDLNPLIYQPFEFNQIPEIPEVPEEIYQNHKIEEDIPPCCKGETVCKIDEDCQLYGCKVECLGRCQETCMEEKEEFEKKERDEKEEEAKMKIIKTLQIYHQGHIDILEDCKLRHVNEDGVVEIHQLAISEQNPVGCKPLKEITHISSFVDFFEQIEKLIAEKKVPLTLDMIVNSCNTLICSKVKQEPVCHEEHSLEHTEEVAPESRHCECLAEHGEKEVEPQKENSLMTQEEAQLKIENCLCEETSFLKHNHNEDCGHPRIHHDDHVDYIVNGRLHHVHGSHCDDHGQVLLVE